MYTLHRSRACSPPSIYKSEGASANGIAMYDRLVLSYCRRRAEKLGMLVHATTRIPLSERRIIEIEERMFKSAMQAKSEEEVTERVNSVQDDLISETSYRTPSTWKFCHGTATMLAMRLSVAKSHSLAWRLRTSRILCRRMFRVASSAASKEDADARIGNVYNAALVRHGIAADV